MDSWHRIAEIAAVSGAVALCVIVAGPGGGIEHLVWPLVQPSVDPAQRLQELASGIMLTLLLVPGLALWAWGPALRPAGTALTLTSTAAAMIGLAVQGRMTPLVGVMIAALWLVTIYQVVTVRLPARTTASRLALGLSVGACATPWVVQAGRIVVDTLRANDVTDGDETLVLLLTITITVLLVLPLIRVRAFAPAGFAAAVGAALYAVASLRWPSPVAALPRPLAVLAIATVIAYLDTVRQVAETQPSPDEHVPSA